MRETKPRSQPFATSDIRANGVFNMPKMELSPNDERLLYEAGYLLLSKGKFQAAREVFEGLAAMAPGKALPHTFLGNTYFAELNFDRAIDEHRKALQLEPEHTLA